MHADAEESKGQEKIDLNQLGRKGFNCLHAACSSGNVAIAKYLLTTKRVNPNTPGVDFWTPLEIACQTGLFEIVDILIQDPRTKIQLSQQIKRGSPLHIAASCGFFKICQILLLRNSSLINVKNS